MAKKQSVPVNMRQITRAHIRAIFYLNLSHAVRLEAKAHNIKDYTRFIKRIEKINTPIMREINRLLLNKDSAAADDLESLEAISKAIHAAMKRAEEEKAARYKGYAIPDGWHIETAPISREEFVVPDDGIRFEDEKGWNGVEPGKQIPINMDDFPDYVTEIDGDPNEIFKR